MMEKVLNFTFNAITAYNFYTRSSVNEIKGAFMIITALMAILFHPLEHHSYLVYILKEVETIIYMSYSYSLIYTISSNSEDVIDNTLRCMLLTIIICVLLNRYIL